MAFCKHRIDYRCKKDGLPCIYSEDCVEPEEPKSMTNGDLVRAMSDEELAKLLTEKIVKLRSDEAAMRGKYLTATQISAACEALYYALRRWLKQPAEEGKS